MKSLRNLVMQSGDNLFLFIIIVLSIWVLPFEGNPADYIQWMKILIIGDIEQSQTQNLLLIS